MKNHILTLLYIFILGFTGCTGNSQSNDRGIENGVNIVQVINFHSNYRCVTCDAIEKQSRETIENNFKDELGEGILIFKTVNVNEKANYKLAEEFEASGTALFIHILVDGQSEKVNLTQFAFMNARSDDGSFEKRLVGEIQKALKKL